MKKYVLRTDDFKAVQRLMKDILCDKIKVSSMRKPNIKMGGIQMLKNPFGLRDGSIVTIEDISESERGKKCGCVCPSCGAALIARKGEEREHHFAHDPNHPCDERIAMMISSYTLLKEALEEKGEFCYPGTWWNQRTGAFDSKMCTDAYKQLHHSKIVQIKDTDLRKSSAGIPEALVVTEGEKEHQFAIRLLFPTTVCGQQESEKKYEEYSTLVIDLTDTKTGDGWTVQKWKKFYCDDNEYKKWVWNTKIEEKKKELEKERKKIWKQASQVRWLEEKEHSREPRRIERELTMEYEEMIQRKDRL